MFKVIIAGSREFNDFNFLKQKLDYLLQNVTDEIEIVSGCARGADLLGEQYAKERGYTIKKFPADWEKHKKAAGYIRNKEMGEYANACVVFWMNKSKGSQHMIDIAKSLNLKLRVYEIK